MTKITPEITAQLMAAMDEFKILATELVHKLIQETDQPEKEEIAKGHYYEIQNADLLNGEENLSGNWYFDVHGEHCLFKNTITGQTLEVSLGDEESIGILDPAFFYSFVETTREFKHLREYLGHPFSGTLTVFTELERQGVLEKISIAQFRKK